MKRSVTQADYQSLAELRYQIRCFVHFSEQAARVAGMPGRTRPRIRDLADRLQIQHHSTVELVNRLAAGGYVRRHRMKEDRREVWLSLTKKGENVLRELSWHHQEELRLRGPALIAALLRAIGKSKSPGMRRAAASEDLHSGK
jgi:DNA-binding MarR family transcriptional regulator